MPSAAAAASAEPASELGLLAHTTLGGFQGRKGDGEPSVTVMWNGFQRLVDIAELLAAQLDAQALGSSEHPGQEEL